MLGRHGVIAVELGGIKGNLLHVGDSADGEALTRACGLILVQPVREELLEQHCLTTGWHDLDLFISELHRGASSCMNRNKGSQNEV